MTWVILQKTIDVGEALQIQAYLKSEGIECDVPNMTTNAIHSYVNQPRVWVKKEDLAKAQDLLANLEETSEVVDIPSQRDINESYLKRAFRAAVLGLFIPFVPNLYSIYMLVKNSSYIGIRVLFIWILNLVGLLIYISYVYYEYYEYIIN